MKYVKFERVWLKNHPNLDERWVQERIAEDPTILGLGDVVLKDKERMPARAGRLALLLQDAESSRRYEVEIQLGSTDERHIIRTIEYWDIERKRYLQYDHTAVLIAEDITSRFLNVISLFNGMIPLIAIQMNAIKHGDEVGLVFTPVVNHVSMGLVNEDEEVHEATDRSYWENRTSKKIIAIADQLHEIAKQFDDSLALKYNKSYIGMASGDQSTTFLIFRPKKEYIQFEPRLEHSPDLQKRLEDAGVDVMDYAARERRYRIRLQPGDIEKHKELLTEVIKKAYEVCYGE